MPHNEFQLIRDFIANDLLDDPSSNLTRTTPLLELGILDSLKMAELVYFIERQFSICIDPDEITARHFSNLGSICELVSTRLEENEDDKNVAA